MQLRQLEYFQMVSKMKSMKKTAAFLNVSQPSISVAIKKLEEELGVSLINRNSKKFQLTKEGSVFLKRANEILDHVQYSMEEMNDYRLDHIATVKIGITPIVGAIIFPEIFEKFHTKYPHFKATFIEEGSLVIQELLEKGDIDLGMLILPSNLVGLEKVTITIEPIHVCFSNHHPLSRCSTVSFDQLKNYPFILFKEDTYSRQMVLAECEKYQIIPEVVFSSRQVETIIGLVEAGAGISLLPERIVRKHSNISSCRLANPISIEIGLAWNKNRYLSKAGKAFVDFVLQNFHTT
ncbi:HTH-type transcriptional regulator GltC [Sporomusa rhizae]|uniref:LysR family transcriptional regulator n=1 Tax=Sporomusa rhizae TaxID=357999 RepID=UPI00352AA8B5